MLGLVFKTVIGSIWNCYSKLTLSISVKDKVQRDYKSALRRYWITHCGDFLVSSLLRGTCSLKNFMYYILPHTKNSTTII